REPVRRLRNGEAPGRGDRAPARAFRARRARVPAGDQLRAVAVAGAARSGVCAAAGWAGDWALDRTAVAAPRARGAGSASARAAAGAGFSRTVSTRFSPPLPG